MTTKNNVVTSLPSGLVIDREQLIKLNSEELNNVFVNSCVAERVFVIDSERTFFTSENMLNLIEDKDDRYKLIAEKAGIVVDDGSVAMLQRADELKAEIIAKLVPPVPPYVFASVPEGWSVENNLKIGKTRVLRNKAGPSDRMSANYAMSLIQAERLWLELSSFRKNSGSRPRYLNVNVDGTTKSVDLVGNNLGHGLYLTVGCQSVYLYEIEQLALKMGWGFPAV